MLWKIFLALALLFTLSHAQDTMTCECNFENILSMMSTEVAEGYGPEMACVCLDRSQPGGDTWADCMCNCPPTISPLKYSYAQFEEDDIPSETQSFTCPCTCVEASVPEY